MAITAVLSPRYYDGPRLVRRSYRAVDSQTWKSNQWMKLTTTGKAAPCSRDEASVLGIAADSQATSTSTTDVGIFVIQSAETQFCGYVSNGGNDTTAQRTHIGETAGIAVGSNVGTVTVGDDSNALFRITGVLWEKEPLKNASTDTPGQVIFKPYSDAVLQG